MTDERLEHLRGCGALLNGLKIVECVDEIDRLKHEIQILLILRSGELQLQGRQKGENA